MEVITDWAHMGMLKHAWKFTTNKILVMYKWWQAAGLLLESFQLASGNLLAGSRNQIRSEQLNINRGYMFSFFSVLCAL